MARAFYDSFSPKSYTNLDCIEYPSLDVFKNRLEKHLVSLDRDNPALTRVGLDDLLASLPPCFYDSLI